MYNCRSKESCCVWNCIRCDFSSYETLEEEAINSYNAGQYNRPSVYNGNREPNVLSINSDDDTLDRIVNNYVRHELSNYDDILKDIKGKIGVHSDLYPRLKNQINEMVLDWINNLKISSFIN